MAPNNLGALLLSAASVDSEKFPDENSQNVVTAVNHPPLIKSTDQHVSGGRDGASNRKNVKYDFMRFKNEI